MRTIIMLLAACVALAGRTQAQDTPAAPAFPGKIAYIGADFNVHTFDGASRETVALTDDAGRDDDTLLVYQWPTWSSDGRLAYFGLRVERESGTPSTSVFVSNDGLATGEQVYDGHLQVYNYAYWSPQNCPETNDCRDLAVLLSDPTADGLLVERIRVDGAATNDTLGVGAPFYFSWSPDGSRMLWQRNNQRFDIFNLVDGDVTATLDERPGFVAAPAWSPVDDRLLVGARSDSGDLTDLTIVGAETTEPLASGLEGHVAYAWSPDGNRVAYTAQQGALTVLDAVTGGVVSRSPVSGVYAFFWSPDSQRLAYVTLAAQPGSFSASTGGHMAALAQGDTGLAWSVLDVATSGNERLATFVPTQDMVYLLTYFDQFAQSHHVWSPDSRHIVYSELAGENDPVVTVLDASTSGSVPLTIAEGTIGIWSFE